MKRSPRHSTALLVSRRALSLAVALLVGALLAVLVLLVRVHSRQLPAVDNLELELAAGLLSVALVGLAFVPLRFSHMNRRLERTLGKLETGTARAGENPLGPLGNAFQEHYRLLWRGNRLKEGSIGVHELLLQTLIAQHTGRLVVTDGQGRVRYVSAPMEDSVSIGSGIPLASEPSVHEVVSRLLTGEQGFTVQLGSRELYAYGIFGDVFLRPGASGDLDPGQGLAFVLLSGREIEGHRSHPASLQGQPITRNRGVLAGLGAWWDKRRRRD